MTIADLERLVLAGSPYVLDRQVREALPALLRLARAAARINELVGTETEEGQDVAWEELDAALRAFDFGSIDAA